MLKGTEISTKIFLYINIWPFFRLLFLLSSNRGNIETLKWWIKGHNISQQSHSLKKYYSSLNSTAP